MTFMIGLSDAIPANINSKGLVENETCDTIVDEINVADSESEEHCVGNSKNDTSGNDQAHEYTSPDCWKLSNAPEHPIENSVVHSREHLKEPQTQVTIDTYQTIDDNDDDFGDFSDYSSSQQPNLGTSSGIYLLSTALFPKLIVNPYPFY